MDRFTYNFWKALSSLRHKMIKHDFLVFILDSDHIDQIEQMKINSIKSNNEKEHLKLVTQIFLRKKYKPLGP